MMTPLAYQYTVDVVRLVAHTLPGVHASRDLALVLSRAVGYVVEDLAKAAVVEAVQETGADDRKDTLLQAHHVVRAIPTVLPNLVNLPYTSALLAMGDRPAASLLPEHAPTLSPAAVDRQLRLLGLAVPHSYAAVRFIGAVASDVAVLLCDRDFHYQRWHTRGRRLYAACAFLAVAWDPVLKNISCLAPLVAEARHYGVPPGTLRALPLDKGEMFTATRFSPWSGERPLGLSLTTPLLAQCEAGNAAAVKTLLSQGADPTVPNALLGNAQTARLPLTAALVGGHSECVRVLYEHAAARNLCGDISPFPTSLNHIICDYVSLESLPRVVYLSERQYIYALFRWVQLMEDGAVPDDLDEVRFGDDMTEADLIQAKGSLDYYLSGTIDAPHIYGVAYDGHVYSFAVKDGGDVFEAVGVWREYEDKAMVEIGPGMVDLDFVLGDHDDLGRFLQDLYHDGPEAGAGWWDAELGGHLLVEPDEAKQLLEPDETKQFQALVAAQRGVERPKYIVHASEDTPIGRLLLRAGAIRATSDFAAALEKIISGVAAKVIGRCVELQNSGVNRRKALVAACADASLPFPGVQRAHMESVQSGTRYDGRQFANKRENATPSCALRWIGMVLGQVHPGVSILSSAIDALVARIDEVALRLIHTAQRVAGSAPLTKDVLVSCVRLVVQEDLAKHGLAEVFRDPVRHLSESEEHASELLYDTLSPSYTACVEVLGPQSHSVAKIIADYAHSPSEEAVLQRWMWLLPGIMEYLAAEILELAGDASRDLQLPWVNVRCLQLAVMGDVELDRLLPWGFMGGGVIPHIQLQLLRYCFRERDTLKGGDRVLRSIRREQDSCDLFWTPTEFRDRFLSTPHSSAELARAVPEAEQIGLQWSLETYAHSVVVDALLMHIRAGELSEPLSRHTGREEPCSCPQNPRPDG